MESDNNVDPNQDVRESFGLGQGENHQETESRIHPFGDRHDSSAENIQGAANPPLPPPLPPPSVINPRIPGLGKFCYFAGRSVGTSPY